VKKKNFKFAIFFTLSKRDRYTTHKEVLYIGSKTASPSLSVLISVRIFKKSQKIKNKIIQKKDRFFVCPTPGLDPNLNVDEDEEELHLLALALEVDLALWEPDVGCPFETTETGPETSFATIRNKMFVLLLHRKRKFRCFA
jgi:hypothetical protein